MSILSLIKRAPKRTSAVVMMLALAIIVPATLFAWGPNRPLFTTAGPADYVTFNSITDNPVQGYEPNFMRAKAATASNSTYADNVTVEEGKEYTIFVYYHNNASSHLNASGAGIAQGTYVRAEIPAIVSGNTSSVAYIGASNATPTVVWDDVTFTSSSSLRLNMVPGSARIYNAGATNGATLSDSIVTTGAPIGHDALNGVVPGCNEFAGYITFNVKATKPTFTVQKQVRVAGTTEYTENVTAKAGDTLEYRIEYKNTGATSQNNVTVKDTLPAHVSYIPGSTTLKNAANPNGKSVSDNIVGAGLNIGDYTAGSNAYVKFNAKVGAIDTLECGTKTLTNVAKVTVGGVTNQDTATATVTKICDKDITVCELATKKIVTIKESQFNTTKYSKNLNDCKVPGKIVVCEIATKQIVTIDESAFNTDKYTKDLSKCATTPPELPKTGPAENIVAFLGLGALIASVVYYVRSRSLQA